MSDELKREDLTTEDIVAAMMEPIQQPANSLEESAAELKAMGFRDISQADDKGAMAEAMKSVQITKVLEDSHNANQPKMTIKEHLEHHAKFLLSVSPGKDLAFIVGNMTVEHAQAILITTAKMNNVPDAVIKKHLKTLRKKYS
ncbi:MAG: hypothetical protein DRH57_05000 [Candidatus Cloacimonadota bacterium]|nr:MAG: hypothetical protein DRH57_05000 [Candidatus Cloacimonadota bacterium]